MRQAASYSDLARSSETSTPPYSLSLVSPRAATAAGLTGAVPNVDSAIIASHTVCYDMSYSKAATPFVSWSIERGCARAHKGWGMLVEQAAESFTLWRGVRPDTDPVLDVLGAK